MKSIHALLRNTQFLFEQMRNPKQWGVILLELAIISLLGLAGFGAAMGAFTTHWWWPLQLSGKIILLFWGTYALTTPSLIVFSALRGSRIGGMQLCYLLIGSLATSGIVLAALLPITWFFAWTDEIHVGPMVRLIHIFAFFIAFFFGTQFLAKGMRAFHREEKQRDAHHSSATDILLIWSVLVLIVGIQLAHKIGPWYEQPQGMACSTGLLDSNCIPQPEE
ncbi:MAG: hypothetical protein KIH62_005275 [Candidatus Kerfeldbacteria bacterium]|nr:hypothetical protein [Candidatus Kerfeldbacteria bacterium]